MIWPTKQTSPYGFNVTGKIVFGIIFDASRSRCAHCPDEGGEDGLAAMAVARLIVEKARIKREFFKLTRIVKHPFHDRSRGKFPICLSCRHI